MSGARTSPFQFELMVEFMERNGDLNKPSDGPASRINAIVKWEELCSALNSDTSGGQKPVEKWKKVWSDLKNNTKRKALKISQAARSPSGGSTCKLALSDLELRVLNIKKQMARHSGHINVAESFLEISPMERSNSSMVTSIKDELPIETDDVESENSNKELSPEPDIDFNHTKRQDVNSLLVVLEKGTISDVDESDSRTDMSTQHKLLRVGSDNVHRNETVMLVDCFDEEEDTQEPVKAKSSNKKPKLEVEDWNETAAESSKDPLQEPENRTKFKPRIFRKVKPKSAALKAFLECDKYARESERERSRMWYEIEKERIRQRDVELQLQRQWLQFMKEALVVVKDLVDSKK